MTRTLPLLSLVVGVAAGTLGCAPAERHQSGIDGSEADVRTALGVEGAHEVVACTRLGRGRVVRGLGAEGYRGVALDDKTKARTDAVDALMNDHLRSSLRMVPSVWSTGVGTPCREGASIGGVVTMSSWRDVDQAITIVATLLESDHLGETVSIEVESIPVADAED